VGNAKVIINCVVILEDSRLRVYSGTNGRFIDTYDIDASKKFTILDIEDALIAGQHWDANDSLNSMKDKFLAKKKK
jgi:hypothetical protein